MQKSKSKYLGTVPKVPAKFKEVGFRTAMNNRNDLKKVFTQYGWGKAADPSSIGSVYFRSTRNNKETMRSNLKIKYYIGKIDDKDVLAVDHEGEVHLFLRKKPKPRKREGLMDPIM